MKKDTILHNSFEISIFLKAVEAIAEIFSGTVLFFVASSTINNVIYFISRSELSEDPNDFVFNYLIHFANHFSVSSQSFVALYLLWHGIVKLFMVSFLWKGKLWAYPISIIFFFIFILYQLHRFLFTHSIWLILLTFLDLVVVYLTWMEYKRISFKKQ